MKISLNKTLFNNGNNNATSSLTLRIERERERKEIIVREYKDQEN